VRRREQAWLGDDALAVSQEAATSEILGADLPASVEFQDPELKPFRPNEGRYQLLIFSQKAVVRRAQHVVDSDAVLGERKQSTPI
jgi:hypothetical protein